MNTNMLKTFTMIIMFNEFQKEELFLVYKNIKIRVILNHVLSYLPAILLLVCDWEICCIKYT